MNRYIVYKATNMINGKIYRSKKKIIDSNGIIYSSVNEAADKNNIKRTTLTARLTGQSSQKKQILKFYYLESNSICL